MASSPYQFYDTKLFLDGKEVAFKSFTIGTPPGFEIVADDPFTLPRRRRLMRRSPEVTINADLSPIAAFVYERIAATTTLQVESTEKVWEFPKERFVEYGPEDVWWAKKLGFGKEVWARQVVELKGNISQASSEGLTFQAVSIRRMQ